MFITTSVRPRDPIIDYGTKRNRWKRIDLRWGCREQSKRTPLVKTGNKG